MKTYKLLLIKPAQILGGRPMKFRTAYIATRALPYLAALTPSDFEVSIVDDNIDEIDFDAPVDLVGITSLLPQVPRLIQIADAFRERGVPVVAGGVGASSVPDAVRPHVDCLVVGEGETTWPQALADFKAGRLQPEYRSDTFFSMENMPAPRFDLLNPNGYMRATRVASCSGLSRIPIETSRGCPHNCSFCYVSRFFGRRMRLRPIEDVVREVERFPGAYILFVDDNIGAVPQRAKALFRALTPLGIRWFGQFSTLAADDPELLDLAAASGCMNAFIGVESVSAETLASVHKSFNLKRSLAATLGAFRRAGIDPHVSLIFGFDGETPETVRHTIDEMVALKVHLMYASILTPLPGTELHEQMEREGRLLHQDYSLYDTFHAVFRTMPLEPATLEDLYWQANARFYATPNVLRRYADAVRWMRPGRFRPYVHNLIGNLYFRKLIERRIHPLSGGIPRD
ncbi:MAG: radical SAM protein [Lentisphaerae bacterium]|nr:radical SAM protein [Lentisphaerota bacterium]